MRENTLYDVVVIGGGPAGLTAAIYLARARYRVVVVEKDCFGGQITITHEVVNYPGVASVSGAELTETMRRQAQDFGAEFLMAEVTDLNMEEDIKRVQTSRGELSCFGVLLATGAHPRKVGFIGEEEWKGRGVAYCATCDGEFFTGKEVFVVGGGFAAAEESVFLTRYASHVTILIREDGFSCAPSVAEPALRHEKITVLSNMQIEKVSGERGLNYLKYRNLKTGVVTEYRSREGENFGVFVFAGYEPATELIQGLAECDERGYVVTDQSQRTTCTGLYAAGDVCIKSLRQVVTAVGEGALAATELERYAAIMQKKTGLHPVFSASEKKKAEKKVEMRNKSESIFSADMLTQLNAVFQRMESSLILKLYLENTELSTELQDYMSELASLTEKLTVQTVMDKEDTDVQERPCVRICKADGTWTGLAFHGVPGGHEFNSFVLGIYNAAGPGQSLDKETRQRILQLPVTRIKILISLSCTMCPDLVTAAQRIAAEHPMVTAEVYDLNHFPNLREKYQVMSVPCLVLNDGEKVSFGKRNIQQLLELLEK